MAISLIHHPKIFFADEPTIGLDVLAKARFREILLKWCQKKKMTFFLTSHDHGDIQALCERALVLERGVLSYDGQLTDLLKKSLLSD